MKKFFRSIPHWCWPLLAGLLLLPVPLLRDFHIESALIIAAAGCFMAAWTACRKSSKTDGERIVLLLRTLYLVGVPLLLFAIMVGCLSIHGIGFWLLYPLPSVLYGYSLGRLLRLWQVPYRRLIAIAALLFVAVGVLAVEFFHLPQVYFLNHVWGGWPGPIYDETVTVSRSLLYFRGGTLAWAVLFWWLPSFRQSLKPKIIAAACAVLLLAGYSRLAPLGIISPEPYLQEQLAGSKETPHFRIYYDEEHYSADEIDFIALKHEFYLQQISRQLNLTLPNASHKIATYLYAHPWQKKALTGAKFTSYVPVWLEQDQLHIAKQQIAGSLKHELVHVLAKQFGNRLLNASWSIGLIEGLAVAIAPDESPVTTINQIVVSEKPYPSAAEMQHALSPWGFYGGRAAVNYTQSGSFVQYLLQNYPANQFKQAYRSGSVSEAYRQPITGLVQQWHSILDTVSVDSTDKRVARRLYGFPSLFEQKCPHLQSAFAQEWDQFRFHMAKNDTIKALQRLDNARAEAPRNGLILSRWAYLQLKAGKVDNVRQRATKNDSTPESLLLYADAFALGGQPNIARNYVSEAARTINQQPDTLLQSALQMRRDSTQWRYYRQIVYKNRPLTDSTFKSLYARTQVLSLKQALEKASEQGNSSLFLRYATLALKKPLNEQYFDAYIDIIEWLAFWDETKLAKRWIKKARTIPLRKRFKERLKQTGEWVEFNILP
jgi:hypothetical protein